jgi:dephospho-CoA kinase
MRVVVTGGIGCGKSTVCHALLQHMPGYALVSADQMVRDLYADSVPFRAGLVERFGTTDRRAISALVFADAGRRADLEALSWVYLKQAVDALFEQRDVLFEFPLFFEHPHWVGRTDAVIVLGCDDATQRQRVMARDGLTEAAFARIRAAQLPLAEKVKRADIYLDTSGSLEAVLDAVATLPAQVNHLKNKKAL